MSYKDHDGTGEFALRDTCDFHQDGFCTWGKDDCIGQRNCTVYPDNETPDAEDTVPPEEDYRPEIDLDEWRRIDQYHGRKA